MEGKSIFALTWCCDEGMSGFGEVFQASSKEAVFEFMLAEIKKYVRKVKKYARDNNREPYELRNTPWNVEYEPMKVPKEYSRGEMYYRRVKSTAWYRIIKDVELDDYILKAKPHDLANIIEKSFVDGDSSFQLRLFEVKVSTVI